MPDENNTNYAPAAFRNGSYYSYQALNAKRYPAVFATRVLSYPQIKIRERFRLSRYANARGRVLRADHIITGKRIREAAHPPAIKRVDYTLERHRQDSIRIFSRVLRYLRFYGKKIR